MIKKSLLVVTAVVLSICTSEAQDVKYFFAGVNSKYDEQNPVLSPDGQTLYFTRSNHPHNVGGTRDKGDIWYSKLQADRTWSSPKNARSLNNKEWNGVIGFGTERSTLYLHGHYKTSNGIIKTQGIARSSKGRSEWSAPVDIFIPYFKNLSRNAGGSLSEDGSVLLLSMESYGTRGGEDIYVSFKQDNDQWTEPKNLGSTINTAYQEFSPFLSKDHKILYFSSNGMGGKGSSDIFVSERLDNSWTSWSTPKALEHVNTRGREKDYRTYEKFAIYSSTINSDGYSDLKVYSEQPIDSLLNISEPTNEIIDTVTQVSKSDDSSQVAANAVKLYGEVRDAQSNAHLDAVITVDGSEDFRKEVSTGSDDGSFSIEVPAHEQYVIRVDAPGYISEREKLTLDPNEQLLEVDFKLQAITEGATVNLKNVLFQQSTANILETSFDELDLVADIMKQNPSMKIRLEGHTDNRGVPKHNKRLSKKRAEAVEDYLIKNGISPRRISKKGYGGSRPIADNDDPEKRELNRRVEFTIVRE